MRRHTFNILFLITEFMRFMNAIAQAGKITGVALLTFSVGLFNPVMATTLYNRGIEVYDDFTHLFTRPNPGAYWYIENMGTLADGTEGRVREEYCALQTCVRPVNDNGDQFVRLELFPTPANSNYHNANLSEDVDGADTDPVYQGRKYPGPWNPTFMHPVVVESRVRFGSMYHQDGSGAHGTAGVWLWNNPFSQQFADPIASYDGIGFSWASQDSQVVNGLWTNVVKGAKPVVAGPVLVSVNINDWNVYKFVWSQDLTGNQTVTYYINNQIVGTAEMPAGVLTVKDMGLEVWADNQQFTVSGLGRLQITEHQNIDIDYISIKKN
jgi:hypothetical protein